jgi:uncharacterized protein with HEPN domain
MDPEERILKALEDVQDCASFIIRAAQGKRLSEYQGDRIFRQAIERNLEVIGEAIGRIVRLDVGTASRISEHRHIIAFRNRLIHGYDLLDDELVWETVKRSAGTPLGGRRAAAGAEHVNPRPQRVATCLRVCKGEVPGRPTNCRSSPESRRTFPAEG